MFMWGKKREENKLLSQGTKILLAVCGSEISCNSNSHSGVSGPNWWEISFHTTLYYHASNLGMKEFQW